MLSKYYLLFDPLHCWLKRGNNVTTKLSSHQVNLFDTSIIFGIIIVDSAFDSCYLTLAVLQSEHFPRSDEPRPCNASVIGAQLKSRPLVGTCTTSVANARWRNDEWAVCLSAQPWLLTHRGISSALYLRRFRVIYRRAITAGRIPFLSRVELSVIPPRRLRRRP